MGTCCIKVENWIKGIEVPVPEVKDNESKPKVPARKSTKLIKLKAFKDSTIKDSELSTEAYLRTKSLLKPSHLNSDIHRHQMNEKMYEIKEISIRTTTNSFSTNHQLYQPDESSQMQCLNDDEIIVLILKNHFLFKNINADQYKCILEEMIEYQIEENVTLFKYGEQGTGMFLIKTGQVELTMKDSNLISSKTNQNDNNIRHILNPGETFGELSLVIDNSKRNYSACSLTPLHFYLINSNSYQLVCSQNGFFYTKQYNGHNTPLIHYLNRNPLLQSLPMNHKEDLTHLSYLVTTSKDEEFNDADHLYVVIQGNCICDLEMTKIFAEPGTFLGLESIFQFESKKKINKMITSITNCAFIALPIKALYEVLGMNYKYVLCFQFFKSTLMSNNALKGLINDTQAKSLFNEFKMKAYNNGDVVYSKTKSDSNSKVIIIFDGEISFENNSNIVLGKVGDQFGANMINGDIDFLDSIISKGNSLLFECKWEKIREIAKTMNPNLERKLNKLKSIDIFRGINETKLIDIVNRMIAFSFLKEEVIISPKIPCEHLYFLMKGEVRAKIHNKTIHKYSEGDSFGEEYLLNKHECKSSMIAMSDIVKTYSIPKEYFFELMKDKQIEAEVNKKIILEDQKIKLNDLYFIQDIHKGEYSTLSLVHNKKSLYAIKSIDKAAIDKHHQDIHDLLNEKTTMEELNHPYITKLVKTLKTSTRCFSIIEYTAGVLLSDHIDKAEHNKRLDYAQFYGGCIYLIVQYMNRKGFVHRDINLSNFIIDYNGYVKLINVKTAKNIQLKQYTNTVIGSPHYMAPEVIDGKEYSFACDYWSIGICLYYITFSHYPFGQDSKEPLEIYDDIKSSNKSIKLSKEALYSNLNSLLQLLLERDPNKRKENINDIKGHPFFSGLNWEKVLSGQMKPPRVPNSSSLDNDLLKTEITYVSYLESRKQRNVQAKGKEGRNKENRTNDKLYYSNWFDEF